MSFQETLGEIRKLGRSTLTMAAIGAEIKLRQDGASEDGPVRALLHDVLQAFNPVLLDGLNSEQQGTLLGLMRIFFRDAAELLEHPGRAPGWTHTDVELLEAQGRVSRNIVTQIETLSAERPELAAMIHTQGAFLDVGTGVAHLAIAAAQTWPALDVVGIDIWKPALERAHANVGESGFSNRIEIRDENVTDLEATQSFNLAWLPLPFLPKDILGTALERVYGALKTGGWIIVGQYEIPDDPLLKALSELQIVRSGGYPWGANEIADLMGALGFERIEPAKGAPGAQFVLGQRP